MYEVISIEFHLEDARLIIRAKDCADIGTRHTNIIFYQVLVYSFDDIRKKNIIDEIAVNSMLHFLGWYYFEKKHQKQSMLTYGLPLAFTDKALAIKNLDGKYIYYEINAYIGMDGFIIAKGMKIE